MAQIVHDLAPAADPFLRHGLQRRISFAENIVALAARAPR